MAIFNASGKVLFFNEKWIRSDNTLGVQAALAELLLLASSDHLLLTPASSYGEQAMAINGKPAYYVKSTVPKPPKVLLSVKVLCRD